MKTLIVALSLGLAGVVGCSHEHDNRASSTSATAANVVPNKGAISRITDARCDREQACNNIGAGKSYDSMEACKRELGHNTTATLRAEECPDGINEPNLSSCLSDIQGERCGNPIDTMERVASCRKGKLCR